MHRNALMKTAAATAAGLGVLASACGGGGGGNPQPVNQMPQAALSSSGGGSLPLIVNFDASASTDPDGNITSFRWDFDGNGSIDRSTASPRTSFSYSLAGAVTVRVEAEDDDGGRDSAETSFVVGVADFERVTAVLLAERVEAMAALLVNGNPALAYDDPASSSTHFVRALDAQGLSWGTPVRAAPDPCTEISAAVVDGRPALLTQREDTSRLHYVRAADGDGAAWDTGLDIAPLNVNLVASGPNLLAADGRPAAIFNAGEPGSVVREMFYLRSDDTTGSTWTAAPLRISQPDEDPNNPVALLAGGRPTAIYRREGQIRARQSLDAAGSNWPEDAVVAVQETGDIDGGIRVLLLDGRPAVVFANEDTLSILLANDATAAGWQPIRQVAGGGGLRNIGVGVVAGLPVLGFNTDASPDDLFMQVGEDAEGLSFGSRLTVGFDPVRDTKVLDLGGKPGFAYQSADTFELRFATAL